MEQDIQLKLFWATVLNGTPSYCTPFNTFPLLDVSTASDYLWLQEVTAILPIPFMAVGILTNVLFLLAILRAKNMRSRMNVFLGNIAIVDTIFLTVVASVFIDRKYMKPAIYYESLMGCYFTSAADAFGFYGVLLLLTLTLVFHLSIQHSLCFGKGKAGTVSSNLATLIVAVAFAALAAVQWGNEWILCFVWPKLPIKTVFDTLPNVFRKCAPGPIKDELYPIYLDLVKTVAFFVCFLVHMVLYVMICKSKTAAGINQLMTKQVSRILICNSIIFFLCQTTNRALNMFDLMGAFSGKVVLDSETKALLELLGNGLVYLNSAIRPLIHAACSRTYRYGLWTAITGRGEIEADQSDKDKSSNP